MLHILVEIKVLKRKIRKAGAVVTQPVDPSLHDRVRRGLHNAGLAAVINHARENILDIAALGRRMFGLLDLFAVVIEDCTHEPRLNAGVIQNRLRHKGGGRLAVRPRKGDHRHLL